MIENETEMEDEVVSETDKELISWITARCDSWRDHRDQNYDDAWRRYENVWRGIWDADSKSRDSERSKIISPATQQAVESYVSELDEAIYGKGDFFDIEDDWQDKQKIDVEIIKRNLKEDLKQNKTRYVMQEAELLSAVYGTGLVELHVTEAPKLTPSTQPIEGTSQLAVGVTETKKFMVKPKAISPRNFLIDPTALDIDEALGCAIEVPVSVHIIQKGIEDGIYRDVDLEPVQIEEKLEAFQQDKQYDKDRVKLLKYYGLVPRRLVEAVENVVNILDEEDDGDYNDDFEDLVEAIVVIANDSLLLKAELNPYMMQDRPVVAFKCDIVPGRFWGRGICEKAYNMQVAIDGQLRAHMDNLALTTAPMMAMDSTRMPRGANYSVRPGKTILTNGNPNEVMMPLKFGQTDAANAMQAKEFERMLLMATGTFDTGSIPTALSGDNTSAGISMMLGAVIKKNKRMIVNFQENFLIPFINKCVYRYMQFDPERYPSTDLKFIPVGTLGIMAREYEQQQFIALLQTMPADSPSHALVLQAILANSNLSNKEELAQQIAQSTQPSPEAQQMQQIQQQITIETAKATLMKLQSEAQRNQAAANKDMVTAELAPQETQAKLISAATNNLPDNNQQVFDNRMKMAELQVKVHDIQSNERIAQMQTQAKLSKM